MASAITTGPRCTSWMRRARAGSPLRRGQVRSNQKRRFATAGAERAAEAIVSEWPSRRMVRSRRRLGQLEVARDLRRPSESGELCVSGGAR
jgi:hypothetical protein